MKSNARPGPRFVARRSPVHGRGLFAVKLIRSGDLICEYKGVRVRWQEVSRQTAPEMADPGHTVLFGLEQDMVLDGNKSGNSARWLNHSCSPNCEAQLSNNRIYIYALRDILPDEELSLDYTLVVDERRSRRVCEQFRCYCRSFNCRGTMLEKRRKNAGTKAKRPAELAVEQKKTSAAHREHGRDCRPT